MKWRLKIAGLTFLGVVLLVLGRLFYWQIIRGEELQTSARNQYMSGSRILAKRGGILSSSGDWLVSSAVSFLMYAQMTEITDDARTIANKLAPLLVDDPSDKQNLLQKAMELEAALLRVDVVWLPLARKLNSVTKRNIEALAIRGIGFDLEEARVYPEASSSAHVLGFVGKSDEGRDQGYFGLEGYYDLLLAGTNGYLERESSAIGMPLLTGEERGTSALGGVNLITHINKSIQLLIERRLVNGIEKYEAVSGNVIVIDPETGGIIAMAAYPSYDPGKYFEYGDMYFKNPIISDAFEPGSILKPVIMVAGLDSGEVSPETKCDICDKPLKIDKYEIGTWNNEYHADSTMAEVIQHSDNVGMAFVGQKLGADRMYDYLKNFGFGSLTDIDLQGEASPKIRERGKWGDVDVATASFGQGIAVTPVQMVMAITAIARDGVMITPQVVGKLSQGDWEENIELKVGERVISEKAANEITQMMVTAASEGEAKWTADVKLKVAGKTGTAQIPVAGHYDDEKTIASFVGFAPYDQPKFVMLVTLREPQSSPWASETAAPLWYGIAKEMMRYLD
ncbi:hypothetical protein A2415_05335 [candidate division WWE3 bacterium RIFOXYC1_FULL_39_7]|uniref:Penicillin-binding protein transpeptidase domain-containing protein n=1 Tax=candidate division WWE3 bacterium RIFOXYC1_FULL_39_7 TaxID=1802643 RepID=A0A1F4WJE2_UNCKA|nr:MAG: hypothetical protein A2415_05335 [candidate division WWE3 bacterium RIFOXYC1_FULL_39_7]